MPIRNAPLKLGILTLLFLAITALHWTRKSDSQSRRSPLDNLQRTVKLVPPIEIEMSRIEDNAVSPGSVFTLRATIRTSSSLVGLTRFEWSSTPGAEILSVNRSGELNIESARQDHVLEITVRQSSDQNELIHLNFFDQGSRPRILGTFSYHTLNQDQIEIETAKIIERQKIYHGEDEMTVLSSESGKEESNHTHDH